MGCFSLFSDIRPPIRYTSGAGFLSSVIISDLPIDTTAQYLYHSPLGLIQPACGSLNMKTQSAKFQPQKRKWIVVDAQNQALGRLASQVAIRIRGKHLPAFTPHVDLGDFVVVVNADKVRLTGDKLTQKTYYRYSGYLSGVKAITARKLREQKPERMIRLAVWGMLPKNRLGRKLIKKLKVYTGPTHPHEAQRPETFKLIDRYG